MKIIAVFLSGLLFSLGLIVSGMTNPANVIGFLDIFGNWNISLAFVMHCSNKHWVSIIENVGQTSVCDVIFNADTQ